MTDESNVYTQVGTEFASHKTVKHIDREYVRGLVSTNTVEGFFSIFKRGMRGIYQHCSEKHLHRYLAEFYFRYSHRVRLGYSDDDRANQGAQGHRRKPLGPIGRLTKSKSLKQTARVFLRWREKR